MISRHITLTFVATLLVGVPWHAKVEAQAPSKLASASAGGMEFVPVQPGEFTMGCSTGDTGCGADESPRHKVRITKGFEIGKFEVTQAQWKSVMGDNPSGNKGDNLPVETVSKLDAQEFLQKLNAKNDGYVYRLPTEAEWEYAARAGADSPYAGPLSDVAWYSANAGDETHPVGAKKPNAWGLYDMEGNVREWVSDLYSNRYYTNSPTDDPTGPATDGRGRGGGGGGGGGGRGRGGRGAAGPNGQNPPNGQDQAFAPGGGPRGGRGQAEPPPPPPPPLADPPPGASQQQQIDVLRQQLAQLREVVAQLRDQLAAPFPGRGGPGGFGPGGDPIPTGLPVVRGGGWDQSAGYQRVSARYSYYGPTLRVSDIGFRVVRQPAPVKQ